MTDRETQTSQAKMNNLGPLPECTRCEAMFRSVELFEAHRRLCFGGQVSKQQQSIASSWNQKWHRKWRIHDLFRTKRGIAQFVV